MYKDVSCADLKNRRMHREDVETSDSKKNRSSNATFDREGAVEPRENNSASLGLGGVNRGINSLIARARDKDANKERLVASRVHK
jgi:hypothetical protein